MPPPMEGVNVRRTGLFLAVGLGLVSAGVIMLMVMRGGGRGPAQAVGGGSGPLPTPDRPTDVTQVGLQRGGKARVQFVDKRDPSRTAGQLEWSSLEPREGGYADVKHPTGTIFEKDGSIVLVRAASGRIYTPPKASEPESGTFEGEVTITLYQPASDGTIDILKDQPALTFVTRALSFDLALGEVVTRESWTLASPSVESSGRGIRALVNTVLDRIELLEVQQTDKVVIHPDAQKPQGSRTTEARGPRPGPRPTEKKPATEPGSAGPRITIYRALFHDDVRLEQEGRWIAGDQLETLVRLLDNRLPEGAVKGFAKDMSRRAGGGTSGDGAAAVQGSVRRVVVMTLPIPGVMSPALADAAAPPTPSGPVTLTWTGPLTLRPMASEPPELKTDHIVARFTAERSGMVRFADGASSASGTAPRVAYGTTTQDVTMDGPAPECVRLGVGKGTLVSRHLRQNLGSGIGQIVGPGTVTLAANDPTPAGVPTVALPPQRITWTEQADLVFATARGWMTERLTQAMFAGSVTADDGKASVSGGFLRADLTTTGPKRTVLARVSLRDSVVADGGSAGRMESQTLDVAFTPRPDGRSSDPTFATASGGVTASRPGERLTAGRLEASIIRSGENRLTLQGVEAEERVTYEGPDGAAASADRLVADGVRQTVDLFGPAASVSSQGATVVSQQIAVNGADRTLTVPQAGVFRLIRPAQSMPDGTTREAVSLEATWTRSMHVDDRAGTAVCIGDAVAVSSSNPDEIDTARAERIVMSFTPFAPGTTAPGQPGNAVRNPQRKLIRAEAIGSVVEREGGKPAVVESRRYAPAVAAGAGVDPTGRKLERLLYVESPRLVADEEAGTLTAPQPGRLLVEDRRETADAGGPMRPVNSNPASTPLLPAAGSRGTTLFTWGSDASVVRTTGIINLNGGVRMIHRAGENEPVTTLDAARAEAAIVTAASASASAKVGQLLKASAFGGVNVENDRKTLQAETLVFDAILNQVVAEAGPGTRVTFMDPARGSPQSGRKLIWTMGPNTEVRIIEPATTLPSAPR